MHRLIKKHLLSILYALCILSLLPSISHAKMNEDISKLMNKNLEYLPFRTKIVFNQDLTIPPNKQYLPITVKHDQYKCTIELNFETQELRTIKKGHTLLIAETTTNYGQSFTDNMWLIPHDSSFIYGIKCWVLPKADTEKKLKLTIGEFMNDTSYLFEFILPENKKLCE